MASSAEQLVCYGCIHAFDSSDLCDVHYREEEGESKIYDCPKQPCPNRYPRSRTDDGERFKAIRRTNQHPLGPRSTHASRSASRVPSRIPTPDPPTPPRNPSPEPPRPTRGRQPTRNPGRPPAGAPPPPSPSPPPPGMATPDKEIAKLLVPQ